MDRHTELRRLAQNLHKDEAELGYLDALDGEGLHRLRLRLQNRIIDEFAEVFERMAASGKIAPDSLSALLCRKVFGPTLTANMGYFTPVNRAVKLMRLLDADFVTAVAREVVPERAQEMLQGIPVEMMRDVNRKLLAAGDFAVMGGFTDHLPEEKVIALMQDIKDPVDCLRVSCYTQNKARVARLTLGFDEAYLSELIHAAFSSDELIAEVCLITAEMSKADQRRMAELADQLDASYRPRARKLAGKLGTTAELKAYFDA